MKILSRSASETLKLGRLIAGYLKTGDIVCLFGELGSGKTVLTKGIALGLGLKKEKIISPTFVLLREYHQIDPPLYHFDFYRLSHQREILGLGYEEYFYNHAVTVIEWADRLKGLLPKEFLKIEFLMRPKSERLLLLEARGEPYRRLLKKIHENIRH